MRFPMTATRMEILLGSTPMAVLRGTPKGLGPTRAWTSTRTGLVPSRQGMTTDPDAPSGRSSRKMRDGFLALATEFNDRFRVIDGNRDIEAVAADVLAEALGILP